MELKEFVKNVLKDLVDAVEDARKDSTREMHLGSGKESRSPRGFIPRPLLRAGKSVAPPPLPQKNSGGAHHFRFRFLDLCIRFGKIISKACPVGSRRLSFGVCEGFNSGAKKLDTNSSSKNEFVSNFLAPYSGRVQNSQLGSN